jgi:hypothetical protein
MPRRWPWGRLGRPTVADLDSAGTASPVMARHDQHAMTDAPGLFDLKAVILSKRSKPVPEPLAHGLP